MSDNTPEQVKAGHAMCCGPYLTIYDWVIELMYRFVDRCPLRHVLNLYNEHVSANHLDIGVVTGAILDHCAFPASNPRLVLMDLNPNSLAVAAKRLARYHPETHIQNALDPIRIDIPPFDSVGIANLLHCLPGTPVLVETKLRYISSHLRGFCDALREGSEYRWPRGRFPMLG